MWIIVQSFIFPFEKVFSLCFGFASLSWSLVGKTKDSGHFRCSFVVLCYVFFFVTLLVLFARDGRRRGARREGKNARW